MIHKYLCHIVVPLPEVFSTFDEDSKQHTIGRIAMTHSDDVNCLIQDIEHVSILTQTDIIPDVN